MPLPLTVSTAWAAHGPKGLHGLLERLQAVGATGVECEYRLRERDFHLVTRRLIASGLPIRALHNFCPHPAAWAHLEPSGDLFSLSSVDERERSLAVTYTQRTIRHAAELGAMAVVLHLGAVEGAEPPTLRAAVDRWGRESPATRTVLERWTALRAWRARPHLDALWRALEPVTEEARRRGLRLGIETRVHLHEIPNATELSLLLERFGGVAGYWHDTGHAEIRSRYGLPGQREWLDRFGEHLVGLHLSDALGWTDHLSPGRGTVDFGMVAKHLPPHPVVATLEIDGRWPASEVRQGLGALVTTGLLEPAPSASAV